MVESYLPYLLLPLLMMCGVTSAPPPAPESLPPGTLDVRARTITDDMCFAAAKAMSDHVGNNLNEVQILPNMDDWEVFPREAAAVAMKAQEQGLARIQMTYEQEFENARRIIQRSRNLTTMMMENGFIADAPEDIPALAVSLDTVKAAY